MSKLRIRTLRPSDLAGIAGGDAGFLWPPGRQTGIRVGGYRIAANPEPGTPTTFGNDGAIINSPFVQYEENGNVYTGNVSIVPGGENGNQVAFTNLSREDEDGTVEQMGTALVVSRDPDNGVELGNTDLSEM